jgi:two-component system KDP operon response regulator KdpE
VSEPIARILVVDDEPQIRKLLRISLEAQQYEVIEATDGAEGLRLATARQPDLILLDLGLPDQDGHAVLRTLREWSDLPVIVLTVREGEADKIRALDAGADDYVTKPFATGELLARVRAGLRKRLRAGGKEPVYSHAGLVVDLAHRRVTLRGGELHLSKKEYALLRLLVMHAGRVITHQQLLREVWGPAHEHDTQYLRVYVGQLREKLGEDPAAPTWIETEPGVGYRMILIDVSER